VLTVVEFHRKEAAGSIATEEIKRRRGNIPDFVEGGPHNPMGARALYLYQFVTA
jgi:lipoprotein-anchoring transpeptidase ErfK/SrfK